MHNLRMVDLNLLVILDGLLTEQHVSRAAAKLHLTQSAVSHALNRLRLLLNDPLLIRQGKGMVPTSRALELQPELANLLAATQRLLGGADFDPAGATGVVRLAMSDYGVKVVLGRIFAKVRREAPSLQLHVQQLSRAEMIRAVQDGRVDVAMGVFPSVSATLRAQTLFNEHFVCVVDRTNPLASSCGMDDYLAASHVLVSMNGEPGGEVDRALGAIGQRRNVQYIVPHFTVAADLIRDTDLALTIAAQSLPSNFEEIGLIQVPLPFEVPTFPFMLISRPVRPSSPLGWLCERITQSLAVA